jgi:hypothetical protein
MTDQTGIINLLLESQSYDFQYADFGLTPESSQEEVVQALQANVLENYGFNLEQAIQDGSYIMKRAENSNNTYFFPKSTAGGRLTRGVVLFYN